MADGTLASCTVRAGELPVVPLIELRLLVVGSQQAFHALLMDYRSYRHFAYRLSRTSTLFPARWTPSAGPAPADDHVDSTECLRSYGRFASGCR